MITFWTNQIFPQKKPVQSRLHGSPQLEQTLAKDIFIHSYSIQFGTKSRSRSSPELLLATLREHPNTSPPFAAAFSRLYEQLTPEFTRELGKSEAAQDALQTVWTSIFTEGPPTEAGESADSFKTWLIQQSRKLIGKEYGEAKRTVSISALGGEDDNRDYFETHELASFVGASDLSISLSNWKKLEPVLAKFQREHPDSQASQLWVLSTFTDLSPTERAEAVFCSTYMLPVTVKTFQGYLSGELGDNFFEAAKQIDEAEPSIEIEEILAYGRIKTGMGEILQTRQRQLDTLELKNLTSELSSRLLGYDSFVTQSRAKNLTSIFGDDKWKIDPLLLARNPSTLQDNAKSLDQMFGVDDWKHHQRLIAYNPDTLQQRKENIDQIFGETLQEKFPYFLLLFDPQVLRDNAAYLDRTYGSDSWRDFPWLLWHIPGEIKPFSREKWQLVEQVIKAYKKLYPESQASQAWILHRFTTQNPQNICNAVVCSAKVLPKLLSFFERYLANQLENEFEDTNAEASTEGIVLNESEISKIVKDYGSVDQNKDEILKKREAYIQQLRLGGITPKAYFILKHYDNAYLQERVGFLDNFFGRNIWRSVAMLLLKDPQKLINTAQELEPVLDINGDWKGYVKLLLRPTSSILQTIYLLKLLELPLNAKNLSIGYTSIQKAIRQLWPYACDGSRIPIHRLPENDEEWQLMQELAGWGSFIEQLPVFRRFLQSHKSLLGTTNRRVWLYKNIRP